VANWLSDQSTFACKETDGMFKWSRRRSNRMDGAAQLAYEARLKAQRCYWVNSVEVPKIIYDRALQMSEA
jgi:hypothetical protein